MSKRKPPVGSRWRILAHDKTGEELSWYSKDMNGGSVSGGRLIGERTIFDELVICGVMHIEQMDERTWFVELGDEKRMVTVGRDGKVTVGEAYK